MWAEVFVPMPDTDRSGGGKKAYSSEGPRNSKFESGFSGCFNVAFVMVGGLTQYFNSLPAPLNI